VADYEDWGEMGSDGQGLTCSFPQKWMSADGLTLWCVFSAYGNGAKRGIQAHDKFNVVKATLRLFLRPRPSRLFRWTRPKQGFSASGPRFRALHFGAFGRER